ncbi:MAG: hypothetical protein IT260_00955 [Saprospiraceae bacterium]|nr:hypothetical protein [Saprospiraceae bacterium]
MLFRPPPSSARRIGQLCVCLFLPFFLRAHTLPGDSSQHLRAWLREVEGMFETLKQEQRAALLPLRSRLLLVNAALLQADARKPELGYPLLLEKIQIEEHIRGLGEETDLKLLRLRYRKSIEMLKILYEKILSMDHHFTSLRTSQQIMRISNPHEYPEFEDMKMVLDERMKRKFGFAMPDIVSSNPYLSAAFSIVGLALSGNNGKLSPAQLEKISCILDFTVRVHQDLGVIYYETEYLRDANLSLKKECETLFAECSRQVTYAMPLQLCRDNDDWEHLYNLLQQQVDKAIANAATDPAFRQKTSVNLQFSVDRVVHFIEKYCAFVAQGSEYYKKFAKITANYHDSQTCPGTLPDTFSQLKTDIETTLEKFNNAYNLPEIQGSRLKDLLYGTTD